MKKTLGLSLLTLLAAGMVSGAAFADPPFLNGHLWQNTQSGWAHNDHDRDDWARDRYHDAREAERNHWQWEKQRFSQERQRANFRRIADLHRIQDQRRFARDRYLDRMGHLHTAEARFDRNHPWFRY